MSMQTETPPPPLPPEPPPPPSDRTPVLAGIAAVIALVAFGAGALVFGMDWESETAPQTATVTPAPTTSAPVAVPPRMVGQGAPLSFADLVEHVSPAVVAILVSREQRVDQRQFGGGLPEGLPEEFQDFLRQFQQRRPRVQRGEVLGSGFIIDGEGYIVTNNHVVDSSTRISVKLPDGREFQAKVVGSDPQTDVALLKIDNVHNLPTVAFGDDSRVRVGDWVVAVGNPFGLGGTVTAGIVSSIKRDIGEGPYTDFIQIDAPINQGNSGGPTFDLSGRVIAMNSAIYSPSGGSVGIGFAIPASVVQEAVRQIRESGSVTRGWLGVEIQTLSPEVASSLGLPNAKGAIISRIVAGGPAANAGLRQGDVVLSINGRQVDSSRDMTRRVGQLRPGEKATFTFVRGGQRGEVTATIAKRDDRRVATLRPGDNSQLDQDADRGEAAPTPVPQLGLRMVGIDEMTRQRFGLGRDAVGVLVTAVEPSSEAAEKGFRAGDVIVSVGNKDVRTPADVERGLRDAASAGRDSALFLVANRQGQRFVALRVRQG